MQIIALYKTVSKNKAAFQSYLWPRLRIHFVSVVDIPLTLKRKLYKRRALTGGLGYLVIIKQVFEVLLLLLFLQSPQSAVQLRLKVLHLCLSLSRATSALGENLLAADDLAKRSERRRESTKITNRLTALLWDLV